MPTEIPPTQDPSPSHVTDDTSQFVSEEALVLRNYDGQDTYAATVTLRDPDDEVAFRETYTVSPLTTISVAMRLPRALYRVSVELDDQTVTTDCIVGSGPDETVLVEVGNGILSVVGGAF